MDKNKRDRITGLVIGLIGFILLFFFSYVYFSFEDGKYYSFIGQISVEISRMTTNCTYVDTCEKRAIWIWSGLAIIYLFLVWRYRACVGYWAFKSVKVFYKKL